MVNEWETMILEDAIQINPHRNLPKATIAPYVAMEDLAPFQRKIEAIRTKEYKGSGSRFRNNDTLLARITPCLENGKTAFVSELPDGTIACGSTEFIVLSGREDLSDNLFVYYLARDPNFRMFAIQLMEGTSGRQRVPASALARLNVVLPPLPEQRTIAGILGALDDKIGLNRQINQTLEAMAQALFKSWFVDFEPFRDHGMQDSPLGEIPGGWRVGKVKDIASLLKETINPGNYPNDVFEHYSIPAFDEGHMPSSERGAQIKSNKFQVSEKAVLISKLNPRFPRIWLPWGNYSRRAVCSTEFLVVLPEEDMTREYLYSLFSSHSFLETFSTLVTGTSSSHQRVRPEDLLSIDVVIPLKGIVVDFSDRVLPMLRLVAHNLVQNSVLTGIRDTLLPKLLSGQIRVKDAEKFVEKAI